MAAEDSTCQAARGTHAHCKPRVRRATLLDNILLPSDRLETGESDGGARDSLGRPESSRSEYLGAIAGKLEKKPIDSADDG